MRFIRVASFLCALFGVAFLLGGCGSSQPQLKEWEQRRAPMTRVSFTDGEYRLLTPYDGRSRAILFWASWCSSSKSQIARFEALARKHRELTSVEFIAVNIDEQEHWNRVDGVIQSLSLWSIRHSFSGNGPADEAYLAYGFRQIPVVVFVNPQGQIEQISDSVSDLKIPFS